jgi:uncharacterized protein
MKKQLAVICTLASFAFHSPCWADEASHKKAAENLLLQMDMDDVFNKSTDQLLDMQLKQAPQLAPAKDAMKKFFSKYMSWDALKDDVAQLYAECFNEDELNELSKFYQTPVGKKLAKVTPDITTKAAALGQAKVQSHIAELQEMMGESIRKSNAEQGAKKPE